MYQQTGQGPRGRKDRSLIFYLLELKEDFKIGISRNTLLLWNEIFMNFLNMYIFFQVRSRESVSMHL